MNAKHTPIPPIKLGRTRYAVAHVQFSRYGNGRVAIRLAGDEGPLATATVNMADEDPCGENECYIKEWSENEGMTAWLIAQDIIKPEILGTVPAGYAVAHRYAMTESAIAKGING